MQTASVRFHTSDELVAMGLPSVEGLLFEVQSLRSRLDGQEATLHSAIGVLQGANGPRPPRPRPHPAGGNGSGSDGTDSDNNDPGAGSGPPHSDNNNGGGGGPSGRAERERLSRAKRLEAHPDVAEALNAGSISTEQADAIMKAALDRHTKRQLLADAKCQTTDETLAAIKAAIVAADEGDAEKRFRRQRNRRKGLCGVDEHGMTWINILFDPIIGAAFQELFDKEVRRQFQIDKLEPNPLKLRTPYKIGADACAVLFGVSPEDLTVQDITNHHAASQDAAEHIASQDAADEDVVGEDIADNVGSGEPTESSRSGAEIAKAGPDRRNGHSAGRWGGHRVNLTMDLATFNDPRASAYTQAGEPVPVSLLHKILCYSEILLWITDSTSADPGRYQLVTAKPYATEIQKQCLNLRDGCCVWKGCNMRASRCHAHHLTFTREGGQTNISNLALLCPTHHTRLHQMGAHLRPGNQPYQWVLEQDLTANLIDKWTNPPPRPPPKSGPDGIGSEPQTHESARNRPQQPTHESPHQANPARANEQTPESLTHRKPDSPQLSVERIDLPARW